MYPRPGGIFFREPCAGKCLLKSDLNLLLENSEDLWFKNQNWKLWYKCELDEEIAAIGAEQTEKLVRCLVKVVLVGNLSKELALY